MFNAIVMEGMKIGNRNVLEVKAHIKAGTWLGDECVIGTVCATNENEILPDRTVIYEPIVGAPKAFGVLDADPSKVQPYPVIYLSVDKDH
ncbi:hypothetical protein BGZ94_003822 [Podila epigama]|nr:hypothetical protein BGZ94_003822 [Podila epigama]